MNGKEKLRIILLSFVIMVTVSLSGTVLSFASENPECNYLSGVNHNRNDYSRWTSTIKSYLTRATRNGEEVYMKVQAGVDGGGIYVAYYDKTFKILERKTIDNELPLFGAFYESTSYYFLVTGDYNYDEEDDKEVIRVSKYDKNWVRQGYCSVPGQNRYGRKTYIPFKAGSCRVDMNGSNMIIRTAHEMYASSDGLHHQSSMNVLIDTQNMTEINSETGFGYVSHSFNQFIDIDGLDLYLLDHGDAYPRCIYLQRVDYNAMSGAVNTVPEGLSIMSLPGTTGENVTGASVGGLQINSSNILIAGNSVVQDEQNITRSTRNIFLASVKKSDDGKIKNSQVNIKWLTNYAEGEETTRTPHFIQVQTKNTLSGTDDRYMMLWTRGEKLYYVFLDGKGNTDSRIYEKDGVLSDCVPVVLDGNVTWYTWLNAKEVFYQIPLDDSDNLKKKEVNYEHAFERTETVNGIATLKCSKCGDIMTGKVPTSFIPKWRLLDSGETYYYTYVKDIIDEGDTVRYWIDKVEYSAESDITLGDFVVEADDPENCIVDMKTKTVQFMKAGSYQITVYPEYNPDLKKVTTVKVCKKLEGVTLTASPSLRVTVNAPVELEAVPVWGRGTIKYSFTAVKPDGTSTTIRHMNYNPRDDIRTWYPDCEGTWKLSVTAVDSSDGTTVTSSVIEYTVEPEKETDYGNGDTTGDDSSTPSGDDSNTPSGDEADPSSGSTDDGGSSSNPDNSNVNTPDEPSPSGGKGNPSSGESDNTGHNDNRTNPGSSSGYDAENAEDARNSKQSADGTAFGPGASVEAVEEAISRMTSDGDPAGSKFAPLMLSSKKQKKSSIKLSWKGVFGVSKYIIYANKCGKKNKLTKLATVGASKKSYNVKRAAGKKLKKGKYYKFIVIAADSADKVVTSSKIIHVATKGGKVGNHKKIKVKKSVIRKAKKLKKGKTLSIRAKAVPASRKLKVKKHVAVRYESSNPRIATVNKKGKVKALRKGRVTIYCYAQNGISKAVKITVK